MRVWLCNHFDNITTRRSTTLVPKVFALVWHISIRRRCRDGPTQHADSQTHTGAARHRSPSAERLSRSQRVIRDIPRAAAEPPGSSALSRRNPERLMSGCAVRCTSASGATVPPPGAVAGVSSATSERAVRSALQLRRQWSASRPFRQRGHTPQSPRQRRPSAAGAAISAAPEPLLPPSGRFHHSTRCGSSGLHCRAVTVTRPLRRQCRWQRRRRR